MDILRLIAASSATLSCARAYRWWPRTLYSRAVAGPLHVSGPEASRRSEAPEGSFRAESELAAPVEAWLHSRGASCVGHEVEIGVGVPDLVGGMGSEVALRRRRALAPPVPDSLQLRLLQYCQQSKSLAELREWAPSGYSTLRRRALEPLVDATLMQVEAGLATATVELPDPFDCTVAVELKLRVGARGLRQAHGYRAVAQQVFLAVPLCELSPVLVAAAAEHNLGLLAVCGATTAQVLEPAPALGVARRRSALVAERILAAAADGGRVGGTPRRRGARRRRAAPSA